MSVNEKDPMFVLGKTIVDNHIRSGMSLGLGSGSAVAKFAKALGEALRRPDLSDIAVVPSSTQSWLLAKENGLPLHADSAHCPVSLDVAVDGADQVSLPTRSMIKGGGGALLREKIILSVSKHSYILLDSSKLAHKLSRPVPVEVVPFAVESALETISKSMKAQPNLRKMEKGYPFVTESGNFILDCQFDVEIEDSISMERALKCIPGVVEAGIFNCPVDKFYVKGEKGSVESY